MRHLGVIAAILALTLLVYAQVHSFDFLAYDDDKYIVKNPNLETGLTAESVKWAFTTSYFANWHPLTWLSYLLDYSLFGLDPSRFHITNLFIHILASMLLYRLLFRMSRDTWPSAFVAIVFAIHPLHVESVAWASERKDVLCGLFWMATSLAYVNYTRDSTPQRYVFMLVMFALGLMSKSMIVTLPFVLLLLDYWPLRRWKRDAVRRLVLEKVPLLAMGAATIVLAFRAQAASGAVASTSTFSLGTRAANALSSYAHYVVYTVLPLRLSPYYPMEPPEPLWIVFGALLLGAVTVYCALGMKTRPFALVGWVWFFGTLVPVIGIVQVGGQAMADRYMYVPMVGLLIAFAWSGRAPVRRSAAYRAFFFATQLIAVLFFLVAAYDQASYWRNTETLFRHALDVREDNYYAHNKLGEVLRETDPERAKEHSLRALELQPDYVYAHVNLGMIYSAESRIDEAIVHFEAAVQPGPWLPKAHTDLATAYAMRGDLVAAERHYGEALALEPDNLLALVGLGQVLIALGRMDEAAPLLERCLDLDPEYADAHYNLGRVMSRSGRIREAIQHYKRALLYDPDNASIYMNLGNEYGRAGDIKQALIQFESALARDPGNALVHMNMASALIVVGRNDEAAAHLAEALRLRPDLAAAQEMLDSLQ